MTDKPLPKSLHTVTAIVRVARYIMAKHPTPANIAVAEAVEVLGYYGASDPHALAAAALKQLTPAA
jgi:transcription termination factor NusB